MAESDSLLTSKIVGVDVTARVSLPTQPSTPVLTAVLPDLFALVTAEISGADTPEQGDALRVRAALLAWDGLADRTLALELLEDAEHPLAPALRLGLGRSPGKDRLDTLSPVDSAVGSAYLFVRSAYAEAAELAEVSGPMAALVRRMALGIRGAWAEIVRDAEAENSGDLLEEASAVALDRLGDSNTSVELLRRLYDARPHPYVIERLLELNDGSADSRGVDVLRAKLERLESGAAPERAATLFLLAVALEAGGSESEAEAHVASVLADADGSALGLSLLSQRAIARLAGKRGDWRRAAEAWEALATHSGSPTFAGAYLRRAAELWEARVGAADRAEPLFERLHEADPGDCAVASALVRLRLRRGASGEVAAVLRRLGASRDEGTHGGLLLAAAYDDAAVAAWRDWADAVAAAHPGPGAEAELVSAARGHALEGIARGLRAATSRLEIIEHYRASAPVLDARRGAAYLSVAGALALEEGLLDVAGALFDEAASREPEDLLVHAGRAILFERTDRHAELALALQALVKLVESTTAQAVLHKKLAKVSVEHLNDVATAHESYERLLEIEPEDVSVVEAFVRLCAEGTKWARAVELAERAATLSDGDRAAEMLRYAGELSERQLADDDAALRYYERAVDRSATYVPTLVALGALHKKFNRLEKYLELLRQIIALTAPVERRIELLLEYARGAERADGAAAAQNVGRAFSAYADVLAFDPAQPAALQGLERLCRAGNRWADLADVFARAPESLRAVRVRCECFERLESWGELVKVREQELRLLEVPSEIATAARALADLYEIRVHNPEAAIGAWSRAADAAPTEPEPLRRMARLHEAAGRHQAVADSMERELALGEAIEPGRRIELWTKLGELRRGALNAVPQAAQAFEEALKLDPRRPELVDQLVEIYKSLGRGEDLGRMLDARAASANNPQQRASTLREKAELLERDGDLDGALKAYNQAFGLDPESRVCFTAYEKLCYKAERWKQALELYETATRLVEDKKSRAYRLADLYARRGQLQMQYLGALGEAAESYKKVLELDPENDASQTALERVLSAQSDWAGLIAIYERRVDLMKSDARRVEVLRRAARVAAVKMRDAAEAARLYERLHAVDPTDSEATDTLERYYERTSDTEKLVNILRTRLSFAAGGDETIALYLRIAQLSEEGLRDLSRTIEAYQKILELAPSNRDAIDALGRLYEGTERWAELVEVTRRQIRLVTDRAQKALLYFKCGSVMESKFAKEDDAIRYYDAAIKTSPSCLPAVHGLRDLHLRREDWPRVIQTLELEAKLWTEDKERAGVYAHIGQIYGERLSDPLRAIQYYETALQVDRECLPANKALFELYSARGDYQQALALAVVLTQKVSREGDPVERSEFYRKRSIVAEKTGDLRAAVDSLVVALEILPDNLEALDMLVSLCRGAPDAYDYATTFHELEKLHRKRDSGGALARVLVAQASLKELAFDVDAAEEGYLAALKLAPADFSVVEPLVALHERMRRFDAAEALIEAFLDRATDVSARSAGRVRLASLYGDAMMNAERSAHVLGVLVAEDPSHKEGLFLYAQELYLLGRYAEARRATESLLELATSRGHMAPAEELARYYDYLGRVLETSGDAAGSGSAFRRALDLDPSYPPTCFALARRAAATGDVVQGTRVLAQAIASAEASGKHDAALILQRSQARFLVTWGELPLATEAFRVLLERAPDSVEDRLAYADLLRRSEQTISVAFAELERVLATDARQSQAYRQLAQLYVRVGQPARAGRVYSLMNLMGVVEPADRPPASVPVPRRAVLNDEMRAVYAGAGARGAFIEALAAVRESLEEAYPFVPPPNAVLVAQMPDPGLRAVVLDLERVFGVVAEVYVAPNVSGGFVVSELPKPAIYLSEEVLTDSGVASRERRALLGAALEALRGGYGLVTRVAPMARAEITNLLLQLVRPAAERSPEAQRYIDALPRKAQKALEKLWVGKSRVTLPPGVAGGSAPGTVSGAGGEPPSIEAWLDELARSMHRAGLIASDDLGACTKIFGRGTPASSDRTGVAAPAQLTLPSTSSVNAVTNVPPGLVIDDFALMGDAVLSLDRGPAINDLIVFYLSEQYNMLRASIGDAA